MVLRLRSLKLDDWPSADRALWLKAITGPFDIDEPRPAANWSEATRFNCQFFYGQFLRYCANEGLIGAASSPLERTQLEWIGQFLNSYRPGHAETSCAQLIGSIALLVRACHPPDGNPALSAYAYRLQERAFPSTPKITRMASVAELVDLGEHLISYGRRRIAEDFASGKSDFRDGLMVSMLADHPIRRKNFAALQFDVSLFLEGERVITRIKEEDTKNSWPIERVFRPRVAEWIREYAREVRPLFRTGLPGVDEGFLWIGHGGQPLAPGSLLRIVKQHTLRHLGRAVPIHLFRDSVATDIAIRDPQHVGITKVILSHRSFETTEKHYILAETSSAYTRYQQALANRRRKLPLKDILK